MKVVTYIPHGTLPDIRGFSPAIAAYNFVRRFNTVAAYNICNQEHYVENYDDDTNIGPIYRLKEGQLYRRLFKKITRFDPFPLHQRAAKIVNSIGPDIFHAHQLEFPVQRFRDQTRRDLPIVVHAHALRQFRDRLGTADRYIAVSRYTKSQLEQRGFPGDRISVVYNGVDTGLFSPVDQKAKQAVKLRLGISAEGPVLSYIGRKQQAKGFLVFLQTVQALLQQHKDLHVLSVGPTPADAKKDEAYEEICRLQAQLSQHSRYTELPALAHIDLVPIYHVTDIVLAPTLFRGEQHPLAIVEAMAAGCVVMTSPIAGIVETIEHGRTGYFLDSPHDLNEVLPVADKLVQHLSDEASLREAARAHAIQYFDWSVAAANLENIYKKLRRSPSR